MSELRVILIAEAAGQKPQIYTMSFPRALELKKVREICATALDSAIAATGDGIKGSPSDEKSSETTNGSTYAR